MAAEPSCRHEKLFEAGASFLAPWQILPSSAADSHSFPVQNQHFQPHVSLIFDHKMIVISYNFWMTSFCILGCQTRRYFISENEHFQSDFYAKLIPGSCPLLMTSSCVLADVGPFSPTNIQFGPPWLMSRGRTDLIWRKFLASSFATRWHFL